jgi:hypothetical protein
MATEDYVVKKERSFPYNDLMERNESEGRLSEARSRLLDTAARVFSTNGIYTVGIDRIVAEAQVTRATPIDTSLARKDLSSPT